MTDTIAQLERLIADLDRRIPQVARAGERKIAQDASSLRDAARARLAQLTAANSRQVAKVGHHADRRSLREPLGDDRLLSFQPAYDD